MLEIKVITAQNYDQKLNRFLEEFVVLRLEHSLFALSKWEQEFEKPFFDTDKTDEEVMWYIKAMSIDGEISDDILQKLSNENAEAIQSYLAKKSTATWFTDRPGANRRGEKITAEIIYYMMFAANIPIQCEHWNLNRLLTQIRVYNEKNSDAPKMSKREQAQQQRDENRRRREQLGSKG